MRADPAAGDTSVLRTTGLSKSYGSHPVLRDVSIELGRGEIVVVSGANGTGKSTLLRCIAGLTPFRGHASVAGVAVDGRRAVRRLIGYMPQAVSLPANVTVGEVLAFFAALRGADADGRELAEGFLPAVERPIGILSGGQRQRVALAVALLGRPRLLLLDEPVANLDEVGREGFWRMLRDLATAGTSALIASPMPSDLADVADRALVLDDGAVVFDGPIDGPHAIRMATRRSGPERGEVVA